MGNACLEISYASITVPMSIITASQFSDRQNAWKTDTNVKINVETAITRFARISAQINTIIAFLFLDNKTVMK